MSACPARTASARSADYFPDLFSRLLCARGDVARPGNRRAVRILRAALEPVEIERLRSILAQGG